jgi:hypothetical protein
MAVSAIWSPVCTLLHTKTVHIGHRFVKILFPQFLVPAFDMAMDEHAAGPLRMNFDINQVLPPLRPNRTVSISLLEKGKVAR